MKTDAATREWDAEVAKTTATLIKSGVSPLVAGDRAIGLVAAIRKGVVATRIRSYAQVPAEA